MSGRGSARAPGLNAGYPQLWSGCQSGAVPNQTCLDEDIVDLKMYEKPPHVSAELVAVLISDHLDELPAACCCHTIDWTCDAIE